MPVSIRKSSKKAASSLRLPRLFLQPLKLKPIVSGIDIVFVDQLLVSTAFFDAVFSDHDDLIGIADGGQTVGDGDAGPAFSEKTHPHDNKTV